MYAVMITAHNALSIRRRGSELGEERPFPELGDSNGDISGRCGNELVAMPVAKVRPCQRPFVGFSADPGRQFGFDQRLDGVGEDLGQFAANGESTEVSDADSAFRAESGVVIVRCSSQVLGRF